MTSPWQVAGAFAFGVLMGWYVYFVNRYRTEVRLTDLASILGAIGGAAVLSLFPSGTDLFGAYGIGLFVGFFLYFGLLALFISRSKRYDWDWFIDGLGPTEDAQHAKPRGGRAMGEHDQTDAP